MTTWNERLRVAMQKRGVRGSELARAAGLTDAGIKKWIDGNVAEPKFTDVCRVCQALKILPKWLMFGEGAMSPQDADPETVSIDLVDVKGSCGNGVMSFEDFPHIKHLLVSTDWFKRHFSFYDPKNIKIITAVGDSMSPEIEDGDAVFIDRSDFGIVRDGVYAVVIGDTLFVKRIQRLPDRLLFISTNKAYQTFEVLKGSDERVQVLGRVIKSLKFNEF